MSTLYPFLQAVPEELGISSRDIVAFLKDVKKKKINLHGFMIVRHGKVAAEGYWKPFHENYMHRMYSTSKTFTSTAIGLLVGEGKISIYDKASDYFKDYLPENAHPYIVNATIRDLLMMATPYESGVTKFSDENWVLRFFNNEIQPTHPGGSIWHYDTGGTHVLSAIVEKVSGMALMDFLYDRVLKDMGSDDDLWCIKAPEGYSWGGSGVIAEQRDLARLAYLWLNKGQFGGKQYIPEDYIVDGSSDLIDNCLLGHHCLNHHNGYGYQVWREPHNAFAFWGLGTQYAACFRDKDLMFVCTGNTLQMPMDEERIYDTFIEHIWENLSDEALPADEQGNAELKENIDNLEILVPYGEKWSEWQDKINGVTYKMGPNRMGVKDIRFHFHPDGEHGCMIYTNEQGIKQINFGMSKYVEGRFPQWGYAYDVIHKPSTHLMRCLSSAGWVDPNKLILTCWVEDVQCGLFTMKASFVDDGKTLATMWTKIGEDSLHEYWGNGAGTAE